MSKILWTEVVPKKKWEVRPTGGSSDASWVDRMKKTGLALSIPERSSIPDETYERLNKLNDTKVAGLARIGMMDALHLHAVHPEHGAALLIASLRATPARSQHDINTVNDARLIAWATAKKRIAP